ncbi:MAG: sensor histidine kinase [Planctomycetota bacterium]|jgi:signal transduction histidine kinase
MSIRLKVVLAIIGVMTLVFGLLLGVVTMNTYRRSQKREGDLRKYLSVVIERWVDREQWLDNRTWSDFLIKLEDAQRTKLMKRYAIIQTGRGVLSSWGIPDKEVSPFVQQDGILRSVVADNVFKMYPDERYIAVPLSVAGEPCGAIKLEVNTGPQLTLQESFREAFVNLAVVLFASTVILIGITYLVLDRRVLKPLGLLVGASARVADGNLREEVPGEQGRDEMAQLVAGFNAMMREVRDYRDQMEKLVEEEKARVEAAQRRLVIAQRLAATGTLAAGIAHEVNNPLGGMLNAARRLHKDAPEGRQREYLELIQDGLVRVQNTVKKILQFTPREVKPQAVDLREVCQNAVNLVSHNLKRKSIDVDTEFPEAFPLIFGDPSELQQVFLNLLINALDATPGEGGVIRVRGRMKDRNLEIEIEDKGCGMTEEQIARAFDLFYTTKETGKGSGLGLAIVHNIIENHNGRMEIRSELGGGTTVWMQFPMMSDPASGRYRIAKG